MSRERTEHDEREAGREGKRARSGLSPWDDKMRRTAGLTVEEWNARAKASREWHEAFTARVAAGLAARGGA